MLLESYNSAQNVSMEQLAGEEFSFPFSQELEIQHEKIFTFCNDNQNTFNLRSRKDPLIDGIPPTLQPALLDPRVSENPPLVRPPPARQKNQNQGNVPTILKNLAWSMEKYNAMEDLKWTKANMSIFDML